MVVIALSNVAQQEQTNFLLLHGHFFFFNLALKSSFEPANFGNSLKKKSKYTHYKFPKLILTYFSCFKFFDFVLKKIRFPSYFEKYYFIIEINSFLSEEILIKIK